ncbi:MAG: MBL fold metallo-hydrolase [Promethearchaeota archaeon]
MILKKLIVGSIGTNCYVFGSDKEVVIIDPGGDPEMIISTIEELGVTPIAILLTHEHFDHTTGVEGVLNRYKIPLMYSKNGFRSHVQEANKRLAEGDEIKIDNISLRVLETPGHSRGGVCYYTKEVKEIDGKKIDGIIFTGDLLFRRSIGRTDIGGGNQTELFSSIKNKIMYNPELTDNFLVLPGHMGITSIGEERSSNMYKSYFL